MDMLLAIVTMLLNLVGVPVGGSTFVHQVRDHGHDVIHARAQAAFDGTRFDCIDSVTGGCRFTVAPASCGGTGADRCREDRQFVLPVRRSLTLPGVHHARICVGDTGQALACDVLRG